jgi:3',5'-cyclic AMP phosphodiesterase CpdA
MKKRFISLILSIFMLASAVAFDGITAFASAKDERMLIDETTVWKYLDDGTDPSEGQDRTAWTAPSFNDKSWKSSEGKLPKFGAQTGKLATFSDGTEIKVLLNQYVKDKTNVPTFFFRTELNLDTVPTDSKTAVGKVVFDDAVIIYVNGTKVASFYEPDGGYKTNLSYGGSGMGTPLTEAFTFPASLLKKGKNVIAVELHQSNAGSSDVYFEMPSLAVGIGGQTAAVMNVGATERERIITWRFPENATGCVEYAVRNGDGFPKEFKKATAPMKNQDGAFSYTAKLEGLLYGTEYVYRLRNGDTVSENFYFRTEGAEQGFDFIFVGDAQIGASKNVATDTAYWKDTLNLATSIYPDANLIVSAGDQVDSAANGEQFKAFLSPKQLQSLALAPSIGNHESYDSAFSKYYSLPNKSVDGYSNGSTEAGGNYFYRYQNALFIHLNTNNLSAYEHGLTIDAAIKAYPDVDWKFIVMHQSLFSGSGNFEKDPLVMAREQLVPLFTQYDIDVVLSGHDHIYSRSHIISDGYTVNKCGSSVTDPDGILYLTAGSSSASKYYGTMDVSKATHSAVNVTHKIVFTGIEVTDTTFKLTTYDTNTKKPIDSFQIIKTKPKASGKNAALNKLYSAPDADSGISTLLNDGIAKTDNNQSNWYAVSDASNTLGGVANIEFDLGRAHGITEIQIHLLSGSNRESDSQLYGTPESIEVFTSENGKSYSSVGKLSINSPQSQPKAYWSKLGIGEKTARYVRVSIKLPKNTRVLLNEIRIIGTPRDESPLEEARHGSVAQGKTYETSKINSTYPDESGKSLTDGVLSKSNSAYSDPVWIAFNRQDQSYKDNGYAYITVDLGEEYLINELNISLATRLQGAGVKAPTLVEAYASTDGSNFEKVAYCVPADRIDSKTTVATMFLEKQTQARFIKYCIYAESSNWILVSEVEAYCAPEAVSPGGGSEDENPGGGSEDESSGGGSEDESSGGDTEDESSDDVTENKIPGDVTEDGRIDSDDVKLLRRVLLGEITLSDEIFQIADTVKDGKIDKYDYIVVKRAIGTKKAS